MSELIVEVREEPGNYRAKISHPNYESYWSGLAEVTQFTTFDNGPVWRQPQIEWGTTNRADVAYTTALIECLQKAIEIYQERDKLTGQSIFPKE